jgi:hypothetical protein
LKRVGGVGGSWAILYIVVAMSLPANGRSRVIISKNTTAAEKRSERPSSDSPLTCSGDM